MDKDTLIKERKALFDNNFKHKTTDVTRVIDFCRFLKDVTGVQVCNIAGGTYEYLPQIYRSVLSKIS